MIAHMQRLPQDRFPPPCADDQVEADGYCQVPKYELVGTLVNHRYGSGRTFEHNVIFGLPDPAQGASWNSSSYIKGGDGIGDLVTSDDNCFIVPDAGFQHLAVYFSDHVDHYDIDQSRALFGLDLASTVVVSSDPTEVFADPFAGDYSLKPSVGCSDAGHLAPH